jgi:hypothetical protein
MCSLTVERNDPEVLIRIRLFFICISRARSSNRHKKKPSFFLSLLKQVKTTTLNPGASPTSIVSYNASAVNIYNASRIEKKISSLKNALA